MSNLKNNKKANPTLIHVVEHVDSSGAEICYERYEGTLAVAGFDYREEYKRSCESCPKHGKNLSCPPHSPTLEEYLNGEQKARVICLRLPLESFTSQEMERYRAGFRKASSLLVNELYEHRKSGHLIAGSGACLACDTCVAETGQATCKKPELRVYSLESLGANVTALVRTCFNLDFEWSADENTADFVCAVGAVFY